MCVGVGLVSLVGLVVLISLVGFTTGFDEWLA
jgi:hypothetical protein